MPVTLSIKNVPDKVARRLREQAKRNRRSLQGELLSLVEHAVEAQPVIDLHLSRQQLVASQSESALMIRNDRDGRRLTVDDLYDYVSSLGKGTPDEATAWIRQARSSR
jgi:plasmid stability protein